jgi:membrane fusion protein, multidrug efflux system
MSPPPPTRRRWIIYSVVALIFAAGVWYFGFRAEVPQPTNPFGFSFRSRGKGKSPPSPVRAVAAKKMDLTVHLRAIGTVVPLNTVTVKSRSP